MTGVTTSATFGIVPLLLPLELLNPSENGWEVMGACNANGTMSRWSNQLLLAAENHHFEGSKDFPHYLCYLYREMHYKCLPKPMVLSVLLELDP